MSQKLRIETFDYEGTIRTLREDFDRITASDALPQVKEVYHGVLFYCIQNLNQLNRLVGGAEDAALEAWLKAGAGEYKKANIETLHLFRTNLLPETDYERIMEKLKDGYLELAKAEEDRELELKKKLVLTLFSFNFTLFFEGGEEAYKEAQEWLMDREFGDIKD